jgi:cellulose synthase/poly-beta-1,6-N-acetylglucosamine synthase-like glycosyltransferase
MTAMVRTKQLSERTKLPSVSVLLPAWNEREMIERCLASLIALDWPDLEIIVCAGGHDGTLQCALRFERENVLVLAQRPGEGKQVALRRCFERSNGEIIYLTDADCIVSSETFAAVIEPIVNGDVVAATGTSRPYDEQLSDPLAFHQWSILRTVDGHRTSDSGGLLGRNCAIQRDALVSAGAFSAPVPIGTDYHLARQLRMNGNAIRYVPVAVESDYPTSARAVIRQQSRWLRNIFLHGRRSGDCTELLACARTVAIGTSFLLWPLSWRWTRRAGIALWFAFYAELIVRRLRHAHAVTAETGTAMPGGYLVRLPWLTLIDIVSWASPLFDAVSPRRRLRW